MSIIQTATLKNSLKSGPMKFTKFVADLGNVLGQLLKQGLDWDWTGTGLELDWSNLANTSRLMQARAYSDEI